MEVTVVSISGGTGKTLLLSELVKRGFVALTSSPIEVFFDSYELLERYEIYDVLKAYILKDKCDGCGECLKACKKGAITEDFRVIEGLCEGCPACMYACPRGAIRFKQVKGAEYSVLKAGEGFAISVKVEPGLRENNYLIGLKHVARKLAEDNGTQYLVEFKGLVLGDKSLFLVRKHPGTFEQVRAFERAVERRGAQGAVIINEIDGSFEIETSLPAFKMPAKDSREFEEFMEEVISWLRE